MTDARREYEQTTSRAAAEADRLVAEGNASYQRSVDEGIAEQQRLVSDSEVVRSAEAEAKRIVESAHADSDRLRTECDRYVDSTLATFEESLSNTLRTVVGIAPPCARELALPVTVLTAMRVEIEGMSNPFILDVQDIPTGLTEPVDTSGLARALGRQYACRGRGQPVEVHGTLSNLGEAVMVRATVTGEAQGKCGRCLQNLTTEFAYDINEVFGFSPDFISGDEADDEEDEPLLVEDNTIDITQLVLDEAGLSVPFNPTCEDYDVDCSEDTPSQMVWSRRRNKKISLTHAGQASKNSS